LRLSDGIVDRGRQIDEVLGLRVLLFAETTAFNPETTEGECAA
jgi:hypothetical protein